jgi:energy-coupling factor transporter ATP-binding protein EcfA2
MLTEITIKNFKSIEALTLPLGRVNVLIGENGSGKSNILEAIGFLGAAQARKLDNEFLWPRGIRNVDPAMMACQFADQRRKAKPVIRYSCLSDLLPREDFEIKWFDSDKTTKPALWSFSESGKELITVPIESTREQLEEWLAIDPFATY